MIGYVSSWEKVFSFVEVSHMARENSFRTIFLGCFILLVMGGCIGSGDDPLCIPGNVRCHDSGLIRFVCVIVDGQELWRAEAYCSYYSNCTENGEVPCICPEEGYEIRRDGDTDNYYCVQSPQASHHPGDSDVIL